MLVLIGLIALGVIGYTVCAILSTVLWLRVNEPLNDSEAAIVAAGMFGVWWFVIPMVVGAYLAIGLGRFSLWCVRLIERLD